MPPPSLRQAFIRTVRMSGRDAVPMTPFYHDRIPRVRSCQRFWYILHRQAKTIIKPVIFSRTGDLIFEVIV